MAIWPGYPAQEEDTCPEEWERLRAEWAAEDAATDYEYMDQPEWDPTLEDEIAFWEYLYDEPPF